MDPIVDDASLVLYNGDCLSVGCPSSQASHLATWKLENLGRYHNVNSFWFSCYFVPNANLVLTWKIANTLLGFCNETRKFIYIMRSECVKL